VIRFESVEKQKDNEPGAQHNDNQDDNPKRHGFKK
jgi:hypothetical protein